MNEFVEIREGNKTALVLAAHADAIAGALLRGDGCLPWEGQVGGRGNLTWFSAGSVEGVVRRYRRGGLVANGILKDGYLLENRILWEFDVHRNAQERGVPVAKLLGVCWERNTFVYRGAIASELIDASTLRGWLESRFLDDALNRCGGSIRIMHDAGVWHADLNIDNLVVNDRAWIIDFDKARARKRVSEFQRARNLLRLERSLKKAGAGADAFARILEGYGTIQIPMWLARAYAAKGWASDWVRVLAEYFTEENYAYWHSPETDVSATPTEHDEPDEVLKTSTIRRTVRVGDFVIKTHERGGIWNSITRPVAPGNFHNPFRAAQHAWERSAPVPKPYYCSVSWRFFGYGQSSEVYGYLHGCVNAEKYARRLVQANDAPDTIRLYLRAIAAAVQSLERAGAYHADLSGKNILTREGREFWIIDLDSLRISGAHSRRRRLKNHVQLYDSFCDVFSEELLDEFIGSMLPEGIDRADWLARVKAGQRKRRARQEGIWRQQGVRK